MAILFALNYGQHERQWEFCFHQVSSFRIVCILICVCMCVYVCGCMYPCMWGVDRQTDSETDTYLDRYHVQGPLDRGRSPVRGSARCP